MHPELPENRHPICYHLCPRMYAMAKMLKKCERVGENVNEITRGALCKVVKFTKMANLAKIGQGLGE